MFKCTCKICKNLL